MNSFYLIDKQIGITSFQVLRELRKKLNTRKMGHTGTLDPLASGLLLVGVGNYTKLISYFEKDTKEYEFKINLDGTTPSFDKETQIKYLSNEKIEYLKKNLKKENIKEILDSNFFGKINQLPPKYSALKIGGKKAVNMVRTGEDFELKKRQITIFSIEILGFSYPELHLKAKVSAGTYIRSIANDLGKFLGTGGYITFLRRTKIGKLDISLSQKLNNFSKNNFLKEEVLFPQNNFIFLKKEELEDLDNGKKIKNNYSNLKNNEIYFVKNKSLITNIIKLENDFLIPVRKI